jgi:hypothetical protein
MYHSTRLPSVNTISRRLNIDIQTAKKIRVEMENSTRRNYHAALEAIDELLGTHGVEGFNGVSYCNTGESYNTTVLYIRHNKSYGPCNGFSIGSWGDLVERYPAIFN